MACMIHHLIPLILFSCSICVIKGMNTSHIRNRHQGFKKPICFHTEVKYFGYHMVKLLHEHPIILRTRGLKGNN